MSKLTLDALKERAEAVTSQDLLNSISGGTENECHTKEKSSFWEDLAVGVGTLLHEMQLGGF